MARSISAAIVLSLALGAQTPQRCDGIITRAATGEPLVGASIALLAGNGPANRRTRDVGSTTSDAQGRFTADVVLEDGELLAILVRHEGHVPRLVDAPPGSGPLTIALAPGRDLEGRIVRHGDGEPIGGASVHTDTLSATTGPDGAFVLRGLPQDEVRVAISVRAEGYGFLEESIDLLALGNEPVTSRLRRERVVDVRVVDDEDQPVAGARVQARVLFAPPYSDLERQDFAGVTSESGTVTIRGLPRDAIVAVRATAEGVLASETLAVRDRQQSRCRLVLSAGRDLTVDVVDALGRPLEGAEVRLEPLIEPRPSLGGGRRRGSADTERVATSGPNGSVTLTRLPVMPMRAEISAEGRRPQTWIVGAEASPSRLRVELEVDTDPPPTSIPWSASVADALSRAQSAGSAVFVTLTMDGERANDAMARQHLRNPEIVRVARTMPCLVSSAFGSGGVTGEGGAHGEIDGVCSRYGHVPCSAHQAVERYVNEQILSPGFIVPQQLVLDGEGRILVQREYFLSERELQRSLLRGLRETRPDIALELARTRLPWVMAGLANPEASVADRVRGDFVALINTGDELAIALLHGLADSGVPASQRLLVATSISLASIPSAGRALRAVLGDADIFVADAMLRAFVAEPSLQEDDGLIDALAQRIRRIDPRGHELLSPEGSFVGDLLARPTVGRRPALVIALLRWVGVEPLRGAIDEIVRDGSAETRREVVRALLDRPDDPAAAALVLACAASERPDVATAMIQAVARCERWPRGHREALDRLRLERLGSERALLRQIAVSATIQVQQALATEALVAALSDGQATIRVLAARALADRGDGRGFERLAREIGHPVVGAWAVESLRTAASAHLPGSESAWRVWVDALPSLER